MSIAAATAAQQAQLQQNALTTAAQNAASGVTPAATASSTAAQAATTGLGSLSDNFQSFLTLLMTQLQNQDPSSPLDSNQFTSELVQFASVQQQIDTNTSLTQLIQLTQSGEILQSSSMIGHQVSLQSNQLPLQNGTAELQFTSTSGGPAAIAVYNSAGTELASSTVTATAGLNTWNWNGSQIGGGTAPDGPYTVAVEGLDASGNTTALPFTVVGTATGVQSSGSTLQLQLGAESVDFSSVKSVLN